MTDKLSSARARLGARMILGPYAEVRRVFSIHRKERFQVLLNLGGGKFGLIATGGSWEEALTDCEANVKAAVEREKAARAAAGPPEAPAPE